MLFNFATMLLELELAVSTSSHCDGIMSYCVLKLFSFRNYDDDDDVTFLPRNHPYGALPAKNLAKRRSFGDLAK